MLSHKKMNTKVETKITVLYIATMPCEVGVAALLSHLDNVVCYSDTIDSAKKGSLARFLAGVTSHVLLLGNYWNNTLASLAENNPNITFYLYDFGEGTNNTVGNVNFTFGTTSKIGPCQYAIEFARSVGGSNLLFDALVRLHKPAIEMIDERIFNKNITDNQIMYSGLYNHPSFTQEENLFTRFVKMFNGTISFDDICRVGKPIFNCQLGMAHERATKNAKVMLLNDKKTLAAVTNSPDLINLTHQKLYETYKTDVTICVNWSFSSDRPDQFVESVRSFNPDISAEKLVKQVSKDGGGNSTSAGTRFDYKCPINL